MRYKKIILIGIIATATLTACTADTSQQGRGPYEEPEEEEPTATPVPDPVPTEEPIDPGVIDEPPEIEYEDMEITIENHRLEAEDRGINGSNEFSYAYITYQQLILSDTSIDQWPDLYRELEYENLAVYHDALQKFGDAYEWADQMDESIRMSANCCEADTFIYRADERMLCYGTSYYAMYNGPHPTMWRTFTCFDPQDGKKLELSDVIYETDTAILTGIIWDNLVAEAWGDDFDPDEEQERDIRSKIEDIIDNGELVWGMDDKALLISFDSDALMSYAFGPFSAEINLEDYPDLVYEWYLPQECSPVGGRVSETDCETESWNLTDILNYLSVLTDQE